VQDVLLAPGQCEISDRIFTIFFGKFAGGILNALRVPTHSHERGLMHQSGFDPVILV
jgi:hypothetical protein